MLDLPQAFDSQDTKTFRNQPQQLPESKGEGLSTIRQYRNIDNAILNNSIEVSSSVLGTQAKQGGVSARGGREEPIQHDFSKLQKKSNFKPTAIQEIIVPSILYKLKTYLVQNPIYYFDDKNKTYVGDTLSVLRPFYEMPTQEVVDSWIVIVESLLQDLFTVTGSEQVLLEAYVYQSILTYFFRSDMDEFVKILSKFTEILLFQHSLAPETLLIISVLFGIHFEE